MAYGTSREEVEEHTDLLDTLAIKCLKQGQEYEVEIPGGVKKGRYVWIIHSLLSSAREFPRNEYDKKLRSHVKVVSSTGDPKTVRFEPKTSTAVKETDLPLDTWEDVAEEYLLRKKKAQVQWVVQEDLETEHARFRETLKSNYKGIEIVNQEEVGSHTLLTYLLTPREQQRPTKEEYYKRKRRDSGQQSTKDPALMTPEERREWAKEQARKLDF